jgi:hypothetical protein
LPIAAHDRAVEVPEIYFCAFDAPQATLLPNQQTPGTSRQCDASAAA